MLDFDGLLSYYCYLIHENIQRSWHYFELFSFSCCCSSLTAHSSLLFAPFLLNYSYSLVFQFLFLLFELLIEPLFPLFFSFLNCSWNLSFLEHTDFLELWCFLVDLFLWINFFIRIKIFKFFDMLSRNRNDVDKIKIREHDLIDHELPYVFFHYYVLYTLNEPSF